jgi:hypothetical protein
VCLSLQNHFFIYLFIFGEKKPFFDVSHLVSLKAAAAVAFIKTAEPNRESKISKTFLLRKVQQHDCTFFTRLVTTALK